MSLQAPTGACLSKVIAAFIPHALDNLKVAFSLAKNSNGTSLAQRSWTAGLVTSLKAKLSLHSLFAVPAQLSRAVGQIHT